MSGAAEALDEHWACALRERLSRLVREHELDAVALGLAERRRVAAEMGTMAPTDTECGVGWVDGDK